MEVLNSSCEGRSHITSINPNLHMGIGSDLVDHANRLGIKLKSAGRVRQSQTTIGRRLSARRVATAVENCRTWDVMNDWASPPPQAFVQNVIIPLSGQCVTDEENVRHSISGQSLSGGATARASLPHMRHGSATHSQRSTSTYLDKYVSSTPSEFLTVKDNRGRTKSAWNSSGQALRFQHELENKDKSRILQRTSVIQPHRLDRMYYISGTQVPLDGKYDVDNEEMLKLKDMSKVRREAAHYGRGLSKYKYWGLPNATHLPAPHDFTPLEHAIVNQMMISKRSGYSGEHYTQAELDYLKNIFLSEIDTLGATLHRSQRSWMHLNPASDNKRLGEKHDGFCVVCNSCQASVRHGYMPVHSINLQVPVVKINEESYNLRKSPIMEKYADGWNNPLDCECRNLGSPWMHGTFLQGLAAPTRNNSPDVTLMN